MLFIWALFPFLMRGLFGLWSVSGTFGDTYGAVNALFSGATVLGLIYTILMQKTELSYQRKELKLQRKELKLQREEMSATRNEFVMNRSTEIVYNQLERIDAEGKEFKVTIEEEELKGIEAFKKVVDFISDTQTQRKSSNKEMKDSEMEEIQKYRILIDISRSTFNALGSNYLSILRYITVFSDSTDVLKEVIIRGTLAPDEINGLKNILYLNSGIVQTTAMARIYRELQFWKECSDKYPQTLNQGQIQDMVAFNGIANSIESSMRFCQTLITEKNISENMEKWQSDLQARKL